MKKTIIIMIVVLFVIILGTTKVNAASANITASSTEVTVGTPVTITVNIHGAAWQINVSGAVSGAFSDNTDDAEDGDITKTLSFTPTSAGSYTVNLSGNVTGGDDTRATGVSGSITISVKDKEQPVNNDNTQNQNSGNDNSNSDNNEEKPIISSNANLANLGIYKYDFKGFRAANTSYNTTVPNDVTSVSVYAIPQDKGATYTVSGNKNLDVGTNKVVVTVTASDKKTKKTYYIYVARKENEERQEEVIPNAIEENDEKKEEEEPLKVISIAIDENSEIYLEPEFKTDIYEYVINLKDKDKEEKIDKIPLTVVTNRQDTKIEILGNDNLIDGENVILITITGKDENEKLKYKITVNKNLEEKKEEEATKEVISEIEENIIEETPWYIKYKWYIAGSIILVILIIFLIIFNIRRKKNKEFYNIEVDVIKDNEEIKSIQDNENNSNKEYEKYDVLNNNQKKHKKSYKHGKHS